MVLLWSATAWQLRWGELTASVVYELEEDCCYTLQAKWLSAMTSGERKLYLELKGV